MILCGLAKDFLEQSQNFLHPKLLQMSDQLSYAFSMAEQMRPFRILLKPAAPFHLDDNLDQLFEESKTVIATEIANGVKI